MGTTRIYDAESLKKMVKTVRNNPMLNKQIDRWHNNADNAHRESSQKRMRMLVKELTHNESVTVICDDKGKVTFGVTILLKEGTTTSERHLVFRS